MLRPEDYNLISSSHKEGHIFQTVLSQRWTIQTKQDGFELYKELRELNPSPYLYYYNFGDFEIDDCLGFMEKDPPC